MGGIFSKPKPPPQPDVDEETQRRADMLEAEEGRERKNLSSRRKARRGRMSGRMLMSQVRTADIDFPGQQTLSTDLGGIRNPRVN
jgi:hypothetical protein